jgi:hypothetical protein
MIRAKIVKKRAKLQEVLTGPQVAKYGAMPIVLLPGDDELSSHFAAELLQILRDKGIFRRGNVVVLPDLEAGCLRVVRAHAFSTWVERHLCCYKMKFDRNGEPYHVLRTMTTEQAEKVLACEDFWKGLPEIEAVNPARSLSIDGETGEMSLLQPGYDEKTKTLTFE